MHDGSLKRNLSLRFIHPPDSLRSASFPSGRLRLEPSLEKEMVLGPPELTQLAFYQKFYQCLVIKTCEEGLTLALNLAPTFLSLSSK